MFEISWLFSWCLEGVWRVSKGYLESFWKVSGRCLEDIQKVSGGNFECVRKVTGKSQDSIGGYLEGVLKRVKSFCQFWEFGMFCWLSFHHPIFVHLHTKLLNLTQLELNGVGVFKVSECCFYLNLFKVFFYPINFLKGKLLQVLQVSVCQQFWF